MLTSDFLCFEDGDGVGSWDSDWVPSIPSCSSEEKMKVFDLLESELRYGPCPDYIRRLRDGSIDGPARQNAISWIFKVNRFYGFQPVTAYLAVNYMDRFLSTNCLPEGGRWPWQLLSVACLSVAAKMEETQVPHLLDLQVVDPDFVFHSETVKRMELYLMDALGWRMRPVTPFDFLYHFVGEEVGFSYSAVVSRATDLVLNAQRVVDFLEYSPSAISAAAILCASKEIADFSLKDCLNFHFLYEMVNRSKLECCRRLMDTCTNDSGWTKREVVEDVPLTPQSPVGVLDAAACGSCDSRTSSLSALDVVPPQLGTECAEPTPPALKRRRLGASSFQCTETIDTMDV